MSIERGSLYLRDRNPRLNPGALYAQLSTRARTQFHWIALILMILASGACSGRYSAEESELTSDGLLKVRDSARARLWVKPDHNLGHYDNILIKRIGFDYGRGQTRLEHDQEQEIGRMLRRALSAFTEGGPVGRVDRAGPCAVAVIIGLKDLRMHTSEATGSNTSYVSSFGSATMIVEFRDSLSDVPLLRYAAHRDLGAGPGTGQPGADLNRLGKALGNMVTDMTNELQTIVPDTTNRISNECHNGIYKLTGRG